MAPFPADAAPAAAQARFETLLKAMPRAQIETVKPGYIHSVFRSRVFRFADDVELFFGLAPGVVHFRSASRLGYSDFGANRRRMEALRDAAR